MEEKSGKVTIVSTPIGNLGDITHRAIEALKGADAIYAEDTRVTGKLLSALGIDAAGRLRRLDENMMAKGTDGAVALAQQGSAVAYCSDAGMPGISDPGMRLVRAAEQAGISVEVLPGASAAITAYVLSGCKSPRFYFGGFLPRKHTERMALLESLRQLDAALIFYESPNRIADSLASIAEAFPMREVAVCRELTKLHEEVFRADCASAASEFRRRVDEGGVKGEIVIVIEGISEAELRESQHECESEARTEAGRLVRSGMSAKAVSKELAKGFGISKNLAYDMALEARADMQAEAESAEHA